MKKLLLLSTLLCCMGYTHAQEDLPYQKPPKEILELAEKDTVQIEGSAHHTRQPERKSGIALHLTPRQPFVPGTRTTLKDKPTLIDTQGKPRICRQRIGIARALGTRSVARKIREK